jgi:hypothetical protein
MTNHILPVLLASLLAAACSGEAAPPPTVPVSSASAAAPDPSAAPAASAKPAARPEPTTAGDCKALATDPAAEATPGEAGGSTDGTSERGAPVAELIRRKRPAFRCCFDVWSGKIPEARLYAKVVLALELDPTGKLKSAKAEEGAAPEVASCLADVAGQLTYPASTNGKETRFKYPFDFKPKKRR